MMRTLGFAILTCLLTPAAFAQVALTGTPVQQNFDTLAAAGSSSVVPAGWAFLETTGNTSYTATDGSANSGDTYSAGTGSSTDRAFGSIASNSNVPTVGAQLSNQTGSTLGALTISLTGEQWRTGGSGGVDRLNFAISTNATGLGNGTWTEVDELDVVAPIQAGTPAALDGNANVNRVAISHTITGLSIPNGQTFWIRFADTNISGADDLLAIDDVVLSTTGAVDFPPQVSSTVPANMATGVAPDASITVNFSEAVSTTANWFTLTCSVSGPVAATSSGSGNARVIDPTPVLAFNESCTLTVLASQVTDLDGTPDPMAENYVGTFTVAADLAPSVASTQPVNNQGAVAIASNISVTFSEPVTVTAPWFTIACTVSNSHTAVVSGGPITFGLNPDPDFALSETCTVTILASGVVDQDGMPTAMASDYSWEFRTAVDSNNYYSSVDATNATTLRTTLHALIKDHTVFPYSAGSSCNPTNIAQVSWDILELADQDPANAGRILDVYKNRSYLKVGDRAGTGSGVTYNREHTWPNSLGFGNCLGNLGLPNGPYTDTHMLYLSDTQYNSDRGNVPYAFCTQTSGCGERATEVNNGQGGGTGMYPGNSNWVQGSGNSGSFEAWRARKGDLARAVLYMDIRYEGGIHAPSGQTEPDLVVTNNRSLINVTSNSPAYMGLLDDLLAWHAADAPNAAEVLRNDVVFSFQGNRNPFIDHPEWVACLFQNQCGSGPEQIFRNGFEN